MELSCAARNTTGKLVLNSLLPPVRFSYAAFPFHPALSKSPHLPPTHPSNCWRGPQSHLPVSEMSSYLNQPCFLEVNSSLSIMDRPPRSTDPSCPPLPVHTDRAPTPVLRTHRNDHRAPSDPPSSRLLSTRLKRVGRVRAVGPARREGRRRGQFFERRGWRKARGVGKWGSLS